MVTCHLIGNISVDLVQNSKVADTTAAQARRGKDIQGIPWDRLSITREKYRQTRLEQYKNYENIPNSGEGSGKVNTIYHFSIDYYLSIKFFGYVEVSTLAWMSDLIMIFFSLVTGLQHY